MQDSSLVGSTKKHRVFEEGVVKHTKKQENLFGQQKNRQNGVPVKNKEVKCKKPKEVKEPKAAPVPKEQLAVKESSGPAVVAAPPAGTAEGADNGGIFAGELRVDEPLVAGETEEAQVSPTGEVLCDEFGNWIPEVDLIDLTSQVSNWTEIDFRDMFCKN